MAEPVAAARSLASLHLDALYECDTRGRILSIRGDTAIAAPRVHFFRTPTANHWLFSATLPPAAVREIRSLFEREPVEGEAARWERHEPACLNDVRAVLASHRSPMVEYRGPAFTFPEALPIYARAEVLTDASGSFADESMHWIHSAGMEARPLVVARDPGGVIVAVCHSARRSQWAAEAGVETAPQARRRGLGTAVVSGWASAIRTAGSLPLYSTSWENGPSRALAGRLELQVYGEDWHLE